MHSEFVKPFAAKLQRRIASGPLQLRFLWACILLVSVAALSGCGGGAPADPPASTSNVTLLMQDAPAAGIAEFNIDVSGASLKGTGGQVLTLGGSPVTLEIRHLGLAPTVALRGNATQASSYNSLILNFANPQLTVVNAQGKVIRVTAQSTPSVRLASSSVNVPLTATVSATDHIAVMLDFDLQHSVSTDSQGNYVINPTLQAVLGNSPPAGLQGALAVVSALFFNGPDVLSQVPLNSLGQGSGSQVFQAQLLDSQQSVSVKVDSGTVLDPAIGQFSNIHLGQVIYVSAVFQGDGTFLAKSIGAGPTNISQRYQGVITAVHQNSSGQPTFDVVVQN